MFEVQCCISQNVVKNHGTDMTKKVTGQQAASNASKTLASGSTGANSKKAAGSALSQVNAPKKQTSAKAATAASKTLTDGRTSKASKSAAGSALSQRSVKGGK